ncbi:hypothetical protein ILUMI_05593 [Ignelater luminosus]|uniref:Purple acid phosphatase n=1 Tax=Ignelater luminosus TaxID=2038154 RepID=A0A8K0D702_IGNLU|nr:hypothetical protein ILUMI_05593 [Ignelater luminosus]
MILKLLFVLISLSFISCSDWYQPEQVHLSFGNNVSEVVVTWSTKNNTKESIVKYGIGTLSLSAKGVSKIFIDGGRKQNFQYIHRVTLRNLKPNNVYVYRCGSKFGWSSRFWFKSISTENNWSPHLAIYGDMGLVNAHALPSLKKETHEGLYDAILHIGDFAYDMDSNNGEVGDSFMRSIEPIAAHVPYMTCPGNHEAAYNFSHYRNRFSMPSGQESYWYSFDIGPLHIISISTEVYYFVHYGIKSVVFQYEWLEHDLVKANLPENRKKRPWIIVTGHRPMYCSTTDGDDCTHHETRTRVGLAFSHMFGLEKLLYDYGVDLEIWAHEHAYQRLWPIYNYTVYNGSYEAPYTNPRAPIHFITGSAGCDELIDYFNKTRPAWSAFESRDYGYTRLKAYNSTHLYLEQISADKEGEIIDSFWIIKDSHGAYPNSEMNFL